MLNPDETRERVLLFQRLRELNTVRIEQEIAAQDRALKLLNEKNRATVERLSRPKLRVTEGDLAIVR